MQTGKSDLHPVVLLEAPDGTYWADWQRFVSGSLVARGLISTEDQELFSITDSIEGAVAEIEGFYRNYQSQRYVKGRLTLRLLRLPPEEDLQSLAREFPDILSTPNLQVVEPSSDEVAENDALEYRRIALDFNHQSYGRLRNLIDSLNRFLIQGSRSRLPARVSRYRVPWPPSDPALSRHRSLKRIRSVYIATAILKTESEEPCRVSEEDLFSHLLPKRRRSEVFKPPVRSNPGVIGPEHHPVLK